MGDSEKSRTKSAAASSSRGTSASDTSRAQPAGHRHFGQRHGQPAFAQVVAASDQAAADRRVQGARTSAGPAQDRPGARARRLADCRSAQSEPPSSSRVMPRSRSRLPGSLKSIVTHRRTSGTWPMALIKSVGGIARLRPSCVYSLFRLSLPEMNGVP